MGSSAASAAACAIAMRRTYLMLITPNDESNIFCRNR